MHGNCLIVGVGSHHGQDQLGWQVVDRLSYYIDGAAETRCARSPEDLLDWLDSVTDLHVVDACDAGTSAELLYHWRWPDFPKQLSTDRLSTHGTDVRSILLLAQTLRLLPPKTLIWGVNLRALATDPNSMYRGDTEIDQLAQRMAGQLRYSEFSVSQQTPGILSP